MKTFSAKSHEVKRDWYIVDATGKVLGRVAARSRAACAASTSPNSRRTWTPAIISSWSTRRNCASPATRPKDKLYHRHTDYPGGICTTNFEKLQAKHPERVLEMAVKGMLPKGPLGYAMIKKMKVYAGARASAHGAAAANLSRPRGANQTWQSSRTTEPAAARARWRACSSSPARATSSSTASPSTSSSRARPAA